jgi:ABC-type nitrate/sulfonate/bicarbonate transport system substrate-binding protein
MRSFRVASCCLLIVASSSLAVSAADKLVGIHSAIAVSQSLPIIAREAGLFRKYNLDFDLVLMRSSSTATAALVGGDADVGLVGGIGIISAYVQGAQDFIFIGGTLTAPWTPRRC